MNKIGMSITNSHHENLSIEEQIELYAKTGFDSFFLSCGVTNEFKKNSMLGEACREMRN